ncbi:MAG: hypothetical protein M3Q29_16205 [Chloroflexota bacterium]|nr:hypothetical protein [Chloroflexota bacterium]
MIVRVGHVLLMCSLVLTLFPITPVTGAAAAPKVRVTPVQFSPNRDHDRDHTTVTVTLARAAQLQVRVTGLGGRLKGYIKRYGNTQAAGTYKYRLDGSLVAPNGRRVRLREGSYYAEVVTRDRRGNTAKARSRFRVNNTIRRVSVTSSARYPTLFSPNGDGRKDGMVARFTLSRPADVAMTISTGGRVVGTLRGSYSTSGTKSLVWNGRVRRNGAYVWAPAGKYHFTLKARPRHSTAARRVGVAYANRVGVADKTRPRVTATLSRSAMSISIQESTALSYVLSEPGSRHVKVMNASGAPVNGAPRAVSGTRGSYLWDGRDSAGRYVAAGRYSIQLYVLDRAGNVARQYPISRTVTVSRERLSTRGRAAKIPWSGYWWPQLYTYNTKLYNNPGPLTKYDRVTGRKSYDWEYTYHRQTDWARDWWGHCNGWATAAIMEKQPRGKTIKGVTFSQDDVEGLYAEAWWEHDQVFWGRRYKGGGTETTAYRDVHPAVFDRVVRYYIGTQRIALLMDFTTGMAVWNYPVYAFERSSKRSGNKEYVRMTLTRAAPYYGVRGTTPIEHTFYYTLQRGTDGWWYNPSGSSVHTHPDYVSRIDGYEPPDGTASSGNPRVTLSKLNQLFR